MKAALSLFTALVLSFTLVSQTGNDLKVFLKPVNPDGTALETRDKSVLMSDDTYQNVVLALTYNSSDVPTKFHVKLGDTEGGSEKTQLLLNADSNGLPEGVAVDHKGNVYYLTIGRFKGMQSFYAEVKVETANGVGPSIEYYK